MRHNIIRLGLLLLGHRVATHSCNEQKFSASKAKFVSILSIDGRSKRAEKTFQLLDLYKTVQISLSIARKL